MGGRVAAWSELGGGARSVCDGGTSSSVDEGGGVGAARAQGRVGFLA